MHLYLAVSFFYSEVDDIDSELSVSDMGVDNEFLSFSSDV